MVSVIVPCYKCEDYVERCVLSLIKQDYIDIEIILINDGSPDRTGEIIDLLSSKDSRIKVVHQKNAGVSMARNTGINILNGQYVCFVDSDDWVESNYISSMVYSMEENNVDLVISGRRMYRLGGKEEAYIPKKMHLHDKRIQEFFIQKSFDNLRGGPYGKLYKVSKIKDNHLLFNPNIAYLEDAIFVLQYLLLSDSLATVPVCSYNYELHPNSLVFTIHSFEKETLCYSTFKKLSDSCVSKYDLGSIPYGFRWLSDNLLFLIHRQIKAAKNKNNNIEKIKSLNLIDWKNFQTWSKRGSTKMQLYSRMISNKQLRTLMVYLNLLK